MGSNTSSDLRRACARRDPSPILGTVVGWTRLGVRLDGASLSAPLFRAVVCLFLFGVAGAFLPDSALDCLGASFFGALVYLEAVFVL